MYKEFFQNKKAVIFDLDGTLVDTEDLWRRAFLTVANKYKGYWVYPDDKMSGYSMIDKWKHALAEQVTEVSASLEELVSKTNDAFLSLLPKEMEVVDGFWEIATDLIDDRGMKIALVTNSYKEIATEIMKSASLTSAFDVTVFGDDVDVRKPDPEMYNLALSKLEVKAKDALVFEDSIGGATAANRAGLPAFVVWRGKTNQLHYPKNVIEFIPNIEVVRPYMDVSGPELYDKIKDQLVEPSGQK